MREKIVSIMWALLITNVNIQPALSLGIPNLTSDDLESISMVSENIGWIVGEHGTILRYGGGSWNVVESPTTQWLHDVDMISSNDGWAVGGEKILRWNGFEWRDETIKIDGAPGQNERWDLRALSMGDSGDGWAVGYWARGAGYGRDSSGLLLRWDGAKWRVSTTFGSMAPLSGISMVDSSTGWAVGPSWTSTGDDYDYGVYRWNGVSWRGELVGPGAGTFYGVSASSSSNAWVADANAAPEGLYHWDGAKWTTTGVGIYNSEWKPGVTRIFFLSDNSGWASVHFMAGKVPSDNPGKEAIVRWDGTSWKQIGDLVPVQIFDFDFTSENNGWAVGQGGTILHWDGNSWSVYASAVWPQPFWTQIWFWAIIAIVIIAGTLSVILLKRRKWSRIKSMG